MEEDTTAEGAAEAAAAAGEAQGLPQLDFSTWPNQIFWLIVALVAIYLILSRVALPRIGTILTDRQGAITNDIAAAEELKLQAQEAERAYEQALADARAEAGRIAEKQRQEMKAELDEAMARADAEIAEKMKKSEARIAEIRDSAMQSVEQVAKETAGALVAALGTQAGQDEIDRAVEAQLKG